MDDFQLGKWVGNQRQKVDKMPLDRKERLNVLGFVWDPHGTRWEQGFLALQAFYERHGHCLVPHNHEEDGFRLGVWVTTQRSNVEKMSPDRKDRLNALGFVWDAKAQQWEEGFAALKAFHTREGHCLVPRNHEEDGFRLGMWVTTQRSNVDKMSPDRKDRLNALGFVWSVRNKSI